MVRTVVISIKLNTLCVMNPYSRSAKPINSENSEDWPNRMPASLERDLFSSLHCNNLLKYIGLRMTYITDNRRAKGNRPKVKERFILAPSEKKNSKRKKSRNGFNLSDINSDTGCLANTTPAIKAPISKDKPIL